MKGFLLTISQLLSALKLSGMALCVLVAAPVECSIPGAITASALYQKALTSDLNYSYRGRQFFTSYGDDGLIEAYVTDVQHSAPDQFKIVYEAPARDIGRVILEDNNQQWTFLPKSSVLIHSSQVLPLSRKQLSAKYALLKQNYLLEVDPTATRIADRKVFCLLISAKSGGGPVGKLWIDPYTGLVLRKEQYHADGALDSVMYFSEISLSRGPGEPALSAAPVRSGHVRIVEMRSPAEQLIKRGEISKYFGKSAVYREQLGRFQLQSVTVMRSGRKPTLHLRYSDGLVSLSLFETRRSTSLASTVAHSRPIALQMPSPGLVVQKYSYDLINWDDPLYNLTLVGDVRVDELADLARSLSGHL